MNLQLSFYPHALGFCFARILAIFITVPFFGGKAVPMRIRAMMAFVVTLVILPMAPPVWLEAIAQIQTLPAVVLALLGEFLLGALIGLVCGSFQAACAFGGSVVGKAGSLSMAQSMDPVDGASSQIMEQICRMLFVLLVLLFNGHLVLIHMIADSLTDTPNPFLIFDESLFDTLLTLGRGIFLWGLALAMPVLCASMLLNVSLGLIARVASGFNILFLSMPIRLFMAVTLFAMTIRLSIPFFTKHITLMLQACRFALAP
jgi:flagellar biosynthetic protein FliR